MKPWWLYWSLRAYAFGAISTYVGLLVLSFLTFDVALFADALVAVPFFVAAVPLILSSMVFPWDYGVFGRYWRTPLPKPRPQGFISWAITQQMGLGHVSILLYPDGIGIKSLLGSVFIPLTAIAALDTEHGYDELFYRSRTSTLWHSCPEIRSPLYVSRRAAEILAQRYPSIDTRRMRGIGHSSLT